MFKKPILNTVVQILGKVVMVVMSLVTTAILTRKMPTADYGAFVLVSSVFIFLDALADFGAKVIGVRELSLEKNDKKNIFNQIVYLRLITTGVAFILGLLLIVFWRGFEGIKLEALVSLSMIWLTSLAGSLEILFQTKMRMDIKVIMDILYPALFLGLLVGSGSKITLMWVFVFYLISRALSLLVGTGLVGKIFKLSFKIETVKLKEITNLLKMSWPMGIYMIVFASYDRAVDSMIIQRYFSLNEVAWYGLAYKIYSNLVQPVYFFVAAIFPILSSNIANKKQFFKTSLLMVVGVVLLIIPVVYVLAPWIINVLAGSEYGMSVLVLRWLLVALFFAYIQHLVGFALISNNNQLSLLYIGLTALVVNISLNLLIIPHYGVVGAAIVTGVTEGVGTVLMTIRLWKQVRA